MSVVPMNDAITTVTNIANLPPMILMSEHLEIVSTLEDRVVQLLEVIAKITVERVLGPGSAIAW